MTDYEIELDDIVTGLSQPVAGANAGDGSGRLFIVEQKGRIRIVQDGALVTDPFLDISSRVRVNSSGYDERGLLGLAFHPDYAENGRFFVNYTAPGGQNALSVIAEYHVSANDPNRADMEETRLLTYSQPEGNHNGGQLAFGPDGMLYIAAGDGGGAGDQHGPIGNGQNLDTLLGKNLRINVNDANGGFIPPDNPFVDGDGMDEIWAYGLRNPWRFSFDRGTGALFCADVGQNRIEEINIIEKGGNYGWRVMEGSDCYNPSSNCDRSGKILPIAEYAHGANRISVTGGYVYRGSVFSSLHGNYVFADYGGDMFVLENATPGVWTLKEAPWRYSDGPASAVSFSSFVEDEEGEVYVLYTRGGFFNSPGRLARVTVPGDTPLSAGEWDAYQ